MKSIFSSLNIIGTCILVIAVTVGVYAWNRNNALTSSGASTVTVGATIFPLADIAKQIGGEYVHVVQLVPAGANEHSYELSPQQLADTSKAKAVFMIGHGLDDHIVSPITTATHVPGIVVDKGITLQPFNEAFADEDEHKEEEHGHDSGTDPHYWLAVKNAQVISRTIADELKRIDPSHANQYEQNMVAYITSLQRLDQDLTAQAKQASQKKFIATHNAWEYFAKEYGFSLVFTYEPVEGKQPSLADLQELKRIVQRDRILSFYAEPQKATAQVAEFMKREFGLQTKVLDPLGGINAQDSYIDLMRRNLDALTVQN